VESSRKPVQGGLDRFYSFLDFAILQSRKAPPVYPIVMMLLRIGLFQNVPRIREAVGIAIRTKAMAPKLIDEINLDLEGLTNNKRSDK